MSTRDAYARKRRGEMTKEAAGPVHWGAGGGPAPSGGGGFGDWISSLADGAGDLVKKLHTAASSPLTALALGAGAMGVKAYMGSRANTALTAAQQLSLQQIPRMFHEVGEADPETVKSIWDAITQFAPHVATNPRVAGTFMRSILQFPGQPITPSQIRELQQLELGMIGEVERRKTPKGFGEELGEATGQFNQLQQLMGGGLPSAEPTPPPGHTVRDLSSAAKAYETMTGKELKNTKILDKWMQSQGINYAQQNKK